MKVLVDPEIFFYGRCGMVRYYSRLFAELAQPGVEFDIPLYISGSEMISGNKEYLKKLINLMPLGRKRTIRYFERASKKEYFKKIREGNYDLLFITSPIFEDKFLQFLPKDKHFVMVVHDTMQCVLGLDSFYDPAGNNGDKLAYLIRRAAKVFCISNKVQEDVIQISAVDKSRTTVVYTGNLLDIDTEEIPAVKPPDNYILFVGERSGRKNFRSFIHAVAPMIRNTEGLFIICTGTPTNWEVDLFSTLKIKDKVLFYRAPDPILVYLYKHSRCLVYPSLYEGYGLPVLEAMSAGCPVITSNQGAIPEVGGEAVYYINPNDRESMAKGIVEVLNNPEITKNMLEKGINQAKLFKVDKMAKLFKASMEETLEQLH